MHRFKPVVASVAAIAVASILSIAPALAQTKLKWAHVYETSEPYHTQSVWAAEEIKKRTNGKYDVQVFPASSLGKDPMIKSLDANPFLTLNIRSTLAGALKEVSATVR